jgi:hypothetical protein
MIASTTIECPIDIAGNSGSHDGITPRRFGIALALIILAAFPAVIFGSQTFVYRDFSTFAYPLALYHRESFWAGEFPLWNPLNSFGIPFLAQWNTMSLYPFSLIYIVLPLPWSLNLFCLLHIFLAGMGMFYLMSHWTRCRFGAAVAGVSYAFSGFFLMATIWPNILAVLCWLPWVLFAVERAFQNGGRHLWIAALIAALQMLAGMPEYTLFTWVLIFGLWLVQKPTWTSFRRLTCVVLAVSGLIAAQLLPFAELLLQSKRHTLFEPSTWSLPLWGWANFFVPLFHTRGTPQGVYYPADQPLFTSYYVALPSLVMAIYAALFVRDRRIGFLSAVCLLGVWLALGKTAYLYKWLLDLCPVLAFMRFPVKFVALVVVAVPIVAGFGFAHWTHAGPAVAKHRRSLIALAGACALVIFSIALYAQFRPLRNHDGPPVWWNALSRLLFLAGGTGLLLALKSRAQNTKAHLWCSIALLGCVVLDSFTNVPKHHPTAPNSVYAPGLLATRIAHPPQPGQGRVFMTQKTEDFLLYGGPADTFTDVIGRRVGVFGNLNLIDKTATPDGFYATYIPAARQIWEHLFHAPPGRFPEPLADFAGITHATASSNALEWTVRPNAMPLISAGQAPRFRNNRTNLLGVTHRLFDPRTMVYLQNDDRQFVTVTNRTEAKVVSQEFSAQRIQAEIDAAEPSLVVLSQAYYRPWRAFVDGNPTRIFRANYAFQAVQLPAGRHQLKLVYKDSLFETGLAISLLTLATIAFLLLWPRFRNSSSASGSSTLAAGS